MSVITQMLADLDSRGSSDHDGMVREMYVGRQTLSTSNEGFGIGPVHLLVIFVLLMLIGYFQLQLFVQKDTSLSDDPGTYRDQYRPASDSEHEQVHHTRLNEPGPFSLRLATLSTSSLDLVQNRKVSEPDPFAKRSQQSDHKVMLDVVDRLVIPANQVAEPQETSFSSRIKITNTNNTAEQRASKLMSRAEEIIHDGMPGRAVKLLEVALDLQHESQEIRMLLIATLIESGDAVRAEAVIDEGIALHPANELYMIEKARHLVSSGAQQHAVKLLVDHIDTYGFNVESVAMLAVLYQQISNYPASEDMYSKLLQYDSTRSVWWLGYAISLENSVKYSMAIDAYRNALHGVLDPGLRLYADKRIMELGNIQ